MSTLWALRSEAPPVASSAALVVSSLLQRGVRPPKLSHILHVEKEKTEMSARKTQSGENVHRIEAKAVRKLQREARVENDTREIGR